MPNFYWSSSTIISFDPNYAWCVDFNVGGMGVVPKSDGFYMRAVRGGL